jgi:hypothetical protein
MIPATKWRCARSSRATPNAFGARRAFKPAAA